MSRAEMRRRVLSNPSQRRLARRGGVGRMSSTMFSGAGGCRGTGQLLEEFLRSTLEKAVAHTLHGRRVTVSHQDIGRGLACMGRPMYGTDVHGKEYK